MVTPSGWLRPSLNGLAMLLLAGCAIAPRGITGCNCVRRQIAVPDPADTQTQVLGRPAALATAAPPSAPPAPLLADAMTAAFAEHAPFRRPSELFDSMLFLSGGGEHGAFGAGFLQRWQQRRGGTLPDFTVVTGISTGSILATFAFVGDADAAVAGYSISDEKELVTPHARLTNGKLGLSGGLALIRHGALADLVPLEKRLDGNLSERVLQAVADQSKRGRKLFVGVINVDTGQAEAIDLTDLAVRWTAAPAGSSQRGKLKACYIKAIIASSSAPVAAPAAFIDNRMYIDGGARFGVFSDEIGGVLNPQGTATALANPRIAYILVNGSQAIVTQCGTTDGLCAAGALGPPGWQEGTPHRDWTFLDLALRSEDVVTNQIYRFSADRIALNAAGSERSYRFVRIERDADDHAFDLTGTGLDSGTRRCGDWRARDIAVAQPLQFHARYMRCLIDYGRMVAEAKINGDGVNDPDHLWDPAVRPRQ